MKFISTIAATALLVGIASITSAKEVSRQVPVDDEFGAGEFKWTSGARMDYRVKIIVVDDKLEFCGAFTHRGGSGSRNASVAALSEARILMDGKVMVKDFTFFASASSAKPWAGQSANCVPTGVAIPTKSPNFEVKFRTGNYRYSK
jgi:hypothetical protein